MIKAKLVMVGDQQKPTVIKIKKLPMTIGRGKEADLTLAHPMISRLHCELYEVEGTLCIRDMGSLNGSFVGDVRVTEAALESGDLLTIGAATFKLVVGDDKAGDDEIMPPAAAAAASKASEEATMMSDTDDDDDSFIEVEDKPADKTKKKDKAKQEKKEPAEQVKQKESPQPAKEEAEQDQEAAKQEKKKKKGKKKASKISFDPDAIAAAADDAKDADDDDLSDFLANLN